MLKPHMLQKKVATFLAVELPPLELLAMTFSEFVKSAADIFSGH